MNYDVHGNLIQDGRQAEKLNDYVNDSYEVFKAKYQDAEIQFDDIRRMHEESKMF